MGVVLPLNPARKWKCSSASPSATTSFPATLPRRSAPSSMACSRSTSPAASATCTAAWMTSSATPTLPRSIGTSFTHTPPSHPTCPRSRDPAIAATLTATPKSRSDGMEPAPTSLATPSKAFDSDVYPCRPSRFSRLLPLATAFVAGLLPLGHLPVFLPIPSYRLKFRLWFCSVVCLLSCSFPHPLLLPFFRLVLWDTLVKK